MELPALWAPCHITFHPGIIHHQVRERELLVNSLIESKMKKQMLSETLPTGANDSGTTRVMVARGKEAAPGDPFWIYSASIRHGRGKPVGWDCTSHPGSGADPRSF